MELVPEGPDADALRARMQELMSSHRAEVDRRSPIYGLGRPKLSPRMVGAFDNGGVTLHAGQLLSADGPMVTVRTARSRPDVAGSGLRVWYPEASVQDQMADEHARLGEHGGVAELEGVATAVGKGELWFDDVAGPVVAEVYRDGSLVAARVALNAEASTSVVVTIICRGVPLDQLRLTRVEDLKPYWEGRETYLAALAAHHSVVVRPEDLELPASVGLEAHLALVDFCLSESATVRDCLQNGQRPRSAPGSARQRQRLWEAAVRAQVHLAEQDRATANEHVTQIVNQLNALAGRSPWFSDFGLRTSAVDQVLGFQVFDAEVPTREAQRLWQRSWERRKARSAGGGAPLSPDDRQDRRRLLEADLAMERQAQHAWDTWAAT